MNNSQKGGLVQKRELISGIDGIRGLAAILVLLFHFYSFAGNNQFPGSFLVRAGWVGVDIFFVISGFVLFLPFLRNALEGKNTDLLSYYKRRVLRIVPAYWLNIIFMITVMFPVFFTSFNQLLHIGTNMLFLEGFFPVKESLRLNGVYWTLWIEIQFYLILPFFAKLFTGRTWIRNAVLVIIAVSVYKYVGIVLTEHISDTHKIRQFWINSQLPGVLQEFTFGIIAANIYSRYKNKLSSFKSSILVITGLGMLLLGMYFIVKYGSTNYWFGKSFLGYLPLVSLNTFFALSASILLLGVAAGSTLAKVTFGNPFLNFIGVYSYGIYLWHYPVGMLMKNSGKEIGYISFIVFGGIMSIIWAVMSYHLVEKRFIELGRKKWQVKKLEAQNTSSNLNS